MALRLESLTPSSPCSAFTVCVSPLTHRSGTAADWVWSHLKCSLILCRSRKTRDRHDSSFCPTPCLCGSLWLLRLFLLFSTPTAPSVLATLVTTLLFLMCEMWHYETTPPSSLFWPKNVRYKPPVAADSSQSAGIFLLCLFMSRVLFCFYRTSGSSHDMRLGCVRITKRQYRTPRLTSAEVNLTAPEVFQRSVIDLLGWMDYWNGFEKPNFVTNKSRQKS